MAQNPDDLMPSLTSFQQSNLEHELQIKETLQLLRDELNHFSHMTIEDFLKKVKVMPSEIFTEIDKRDWNVCVHVYKSDGSR